MSDQQGDDDQRRDKLLLRLLKTPPQTRDQLKADRAKAKKTAKISKAEPIRCQGYSLG
jgi:hypothetical protein